MKEGDDHCIDQPPDMNIGHSLKTCAVQKINWDDLPLRMSVRCNEVKWCVDTTHLRSLPKSTPVIMLLFRRFSWLKTWYQFYFRRLSLWSIVGQPACPLTHSSGVFFNWQSTLCSGLNTRSLEIRHSVYFLFLFSLALICCSQGPLLVRGNRGSAGHEQLFQRCEAKLRHPHLCQGALSTIPPKK